MSQPDQYPFSFDNNACKSCAGNCCRGASGYIWLTQEEAQRIAINRNLPMDEFAQQYLRRVSGRLSLQERMVNGEYLCCFFDAVAQRCGIYSDRPTQCRTFPFWDTYKKNAQPLIDDCPGVAIKIFDTTPIGQ